LRRFLAPGAICAAAEIRADHNAGLVVEGIVVNPFPARASLPQKLVQKLLDEGLPVLVWRPSTSSFRNTSLCALKERRQGKARLRA
jgi:hypothetical protein